MREISTQPTVFWMNTAVRVELLPPTTMPTRSMIALCHTSATSTTDPLIASPHRDKKQPKMSLRCAARMFLAGGHLSTSMWMPRTAVNTTARYRVKTFAVTRIKCSGNVYIISSHILLAKKLPVAQSDRSERGL